MHQASYEEESQDAGGDARAREQQALDRAIELLQLVQSGTVGRQDCVNAMLYLRKLWTFFIEDLSRPENGLPLELRANLISIGIWVLKEAERIREGEAGDIENLLAVHNAMRNGLK